MTKVPDSSSRPVNCPLTSAGFQADVDTGMESPLWAEVDDMDLEPCLQDVDPSRGTTASHIGDCNLECCHCAIRWYARRFVHLKDN